MKIILALAAVGAAVLMYGGAESAEARGPYSSTPDNRSYLNAVVDILEYEVDEYADFNLVRMKLSIENLASRTMTDADIVLGGDVTTRYVEDTYEEVRSRGGDVSVDDCVSDGRFDAIPSGATGETTACIMMDKTFEPDALQIFGQTVSSGSWPTQVIPFHAESSYCFVNWHDHCNANNIQRVDGTPTPEPEPEPEEEPKPAALLYNIYNNRTGTLTLVFDRLVVAHNPERIHLIHDIGAYIEDGTAPNLADAELDTADDKRQSMILAFALSDAMRLNVIQSLRDQADLALLIDTRAVYAAEGFVDITMPDRTPILVPDITVVR